MFSTTWAAVSFAAYVAALLVEVVGLRRHFAARRATLAALALSALVAHSAYLFTSTTPADAIPLGSPAEWLIVAAWVLALVYLAALFYMPDSSTGLLLLPLVIALLIASLGASREPFAAERTYYWWGIVHGTALLLGTVTMCLGFLAGLMYLLQSYALKHAKPAAAGLRLPSLERLERINSRSLAFSTLLVALGFFSGLVLSMIAHRGEAATTLWTDPVVLSAAAMLAWLVAAEGFRWIYPAARRGQKVAYLTLASFVFVVITVVSLTLVNSGHGL